MKISHFPDFLPSETVYSVASRYMDRMQFPSHSIVSRYLFGGSRVGAVTDLPSNLEHLIQALPPYHMYTVDDLINRHTLFPLYAPFLPFERVLTLRQRMKADGTAVHWIAGIVTSKVSRPQWLKYCPACVDYDRSVCGESYWHRVHQVPGVLVCPTHEIMLEDSIVNSRSMNYVDLFCAAEHAVVNLPQRMAPTHLHSALIQLANNVKWLLEQMVPIKQGYIQQRYLELLADRGFVTATGKVRYTMLKEAVSDYYPADLLNDLGCGIVQSKENWLANWTTMQHPLHHLLFIQFLCQNTQDFFTQPPQASAPFGNGPWPCLNPLCSHHREKVIVSYAIRQGNLNRPIATFTCQCGFAYSRTGPDTNDDAIFRVGRISQFGDVWDQQLTTYWLDQNISTLQVARLMHTDVETIRRQAARLNLPFTPDIPRRGKRPKIYDDFIKQQRDIYRALWNEALETYSNGGIQKVVRSAHKAYSWLKRHDRDWLGEHKPAPDHSFQRNERLVLTKIQLRHDKYSLTDADLAKRVREAAEEIHTRSGFPVQITQKFVRIQIGEPALLERSKNFDNLPLTSHVLDEVTETHLAFIWRKLRWSVQNFLAEQDLPSYNAFIRRARIGASTSERPNIKSLIQSAYGILKSGNVLDEQIPQMNIKPIKEALNEEARAKSTTSGSLESHCISKQLISPEAIVYKARSVYNLVPILLLTVAAVVNGKETCNGIANWGYQNESLLRWFGFPAGQMPGHSALQKIYTKVDSDTFEGILGIWLQATFPLVKNEIDKLTGPSGIYIPGLKLLRAYRHIAPEVVTKLR